jgi:hypothetical protein
VAITYAQAVDALHETLAAVEKAEPEKKKGEGQVVDSDVGYLAQSIFDKAKAFGTPLSMPQAKKIAIYAIGLATTTDIEKQIELEKAANPIPPPGPTQYVTQGSMQDVTHEFVRKGVSKSHVKHDTELLQSDIWKYCRENNMHLVYEPEIEVVETHQPWQTYEAVAYIVRANVQLRPLTKKPPSSYYQAAAYNYGSYGTTTFTNSSNAFYIGAV